MSRSSVAGVGAEDEVLMPTLTFAATAAAVRYCGAHPHFVDSEEATLGLDADALAIRLQEIAERRGGGWHNRETGRRIAAILPVHIFGHPVDIDAGLGGGRTNMGCRSLKTPPRPSAAVTRAGTSAATAWSRRSALTATRSSPPAAVAPC